MTDMLAAALKYARYGIPIFPVDPADKSPLCAHGFHDASAREYQVRAWWRRWPNAMIGMPTGPRTRIWVLDVDAELIATHPLARLYAMHGPLPNTAASDTPRGGMHFFFRWDGANIRNSIGKLGPGVDVRGVGGYVVIPPSVRSDGKAYCWNTSNTKATEAPSWLVEEILKIQAQDHLRQEMPVIEINGMPCGSGGPFPMRDRVWARAALEEEISLVVAAPAGTRNDTLNRAAFNLFQIVAGGYLDEQEVCNRLFNAADACGLVADDGAPQVVATIKSGASAGLKKPRHRSRY
jgi:putative DNA primase/helicase